MKCPIPLFHGTNSYLMSSIKEYGLGGKNVIEDWAAQAAFNKLFEIFQDNKDWFDRNSNVLNQDLLRTYYDYGVFELTYKSISSVSNWRHGQAYLTGSVFRACTYACKNSEIISFVCSINNLLLNTGIIKSKNEILYNFPEILDYMHAEKLPILTAFNKDTIDFLILGEEVEQADDHEIKKGTRIRNSTFNTINEIVRDEQLIELGQSINFELLQSIPSDKINFFQMTPRSYKSINEWNTRMTLEELEQII